MMMRSLSMIGLAVAITAAAGAGIPWAPSQPLNTNAATDGAIGDYYPQMATDNRGNWVCVWCAAVPTDPHRDFDIYVSRSSDNGLTWTPPERLDPFAMNPPESEDDFDPYVFTDGAGHWVTAWYTSDDHGGTLGSDVDILCSRSTDNGVTWTSSQPLNSDAAVDQDLYSRAYDAVAHIAVDPNSGRWLAVWSRTLEQDMGADIYVASSLDYGASWSAPQIIHEDLLTDSGDDWGPVAATDGANNWVVIWSSDRTLSDTIGNDNDVFVSRSADGVIWSTPQVLNSEAATDGDLDDKSPVIATDGHGRWIAVWYRGLYGEVDDDVVFSVSDDNGLNWSPQAFLNDNAMTDDGRDWKPSIATDTHGRWVAVWYSANTLGLPIGVDDDIQYAMSEDNGNTWSSPGVVNSFAYDIWDFVYDWNPIVTATPGGRWITVWHSKYDLNGIGSDWDLMFTTACVPAIAGDQGCDGDVDLHDVAMGQLCFVSEPLDDTCATLDIDGDLDVDFDDMTVLLANVSGPGPL